MGNCLNESDSYGIVRAAPQFEKPTVGIVAQAPSPYSQKQVKPNASGQMQPQKPMKKSSDLLPKYKWQSKKLDGQATILAQKLIKQFKIFGQIGKELQNYALTEEDLSSISNWLVKATLSLAMEESKEDKKKVVQFLELHKVKISENQIKYGELKKKLFQGQNQQQYQINCSRLFHSFANMVRPHSPPNSHGQNQVYDQISDPEIDELVRLDYVRHVIEKFGEDFQFRYQQIRQESNQITKMLEHCFEKFRGQIQHFKYDLSEKETLVAASMSQKACHYHQKGIFLLLVYFIKSCHHLEEEGKPLSYIQGKMEKILLMIAEIYPPGEGLQGSEDLRSALKKLQKIQPVDRKPTLLKGNKRQCLKKIIIENAMIANRCKPDFLKILKNICLKRSIAFKAGLKYNPDHHNEKAMIRIQEKMFFKDGKVQPSSKSNIQDLLEDEKSLYEMAIEEALQSLKQVTFGISDMVRGKCTFACLEDIVQTIYDIIRFVEEQNRESPNRYRITEIQSRFSRVPPISDVTLKIEINKMIVAELQLTLQSNVAAYNFAHKIYEFNRSKVFSKIKIVHNYYEEYQKNMLELINRVLQLKLSSKITAFQDGIQKYFEITKHNKICSYPQIISSQLAPYRSDWNTIETSPKHQDLMVAILERKIKKQQIHRADNIRKWFDNNQNSQQYSKFYKAAMLYQLIKDLNIIEERQKIQDTHFDQYFADEYGFEFKDYKYLWNSSANIFLKFYYLRELNQIGQCGEEEEFSVINSAIKCLYGEDSEQNIQNLMDMGLILPNIIAKQGFDQAYGFFEKALSITSTKPDLNHLQMKIQLFLAQNSLQSQKPQKARKFLSEITIQFKAHELYDYVIICELMLAECMIKQSKYLEFEKQYKIVEETAKMHGLSLRGLMIAECLYRIGEEMWEYGNEQNDQGLKKKALNIFYRQAISQFSKYFQIRQLYLRIDQILDYYDELKIKEPDFRENTSQKVYQAYNLNISKKQARIFEKCLWPKLYSFKIIETRLSQQHLSLINQKNWPELTTLDLQQCDLYNRDLNPLTSANWPNLQFVYLESSFIEDHNCKDLANANWPKLTEFSLRGNRIYGSCQQLRKGQWNNLQYLNLSNTSISSSGCQELIKANWPKLEQLQLSYCEIGEEGCLYLSKSKWPELKHLNMGTKAYIGDSNNVGDKGCQHLVLGNWPKLQQLYLDNNNITDQGCKYLKKSKWVSLKILMLNNNRVKDSGCKHLIQCGWNLQKLYLNHNQISSEGCRYLSQSQWQNFKILQLDNNKLKEDSYKQFIKAKWPALKQLILDKKNIVFETNKPQEQELKQCFPHARIKI